MGEDMRVEVLWNDSKWKQAVIVNVDVQKRFYTCKFIIHNEEIIEKVSFAKENVMLRRNTLQVGPTQLSLKFKLKEDNQSNELLFLGKSTKLSTSPIKEFSKE